MAAQHDLERKLQRVEEGTLRRGFTRSRDALAALIVVRAIERATELVAEQRSSAGLRRALAAAEKPLAEFIASQIVPERKPLTARRRSHKA